MVKVKICGITREEDLAAAVEAGADALGFVVGVPSSPRNLPLSKAHRLISKIPSSIESVAVTVFQDKEQLHQIYGKTEPDYLQLHGDLRHILGFASDLSFKTRIVGAVNARSANALELATEYSSVFASILLDTAGNDEGGGTGIPHDWNLSKRIRETIYPTLLLLAGGLTPENVGDAIRKVKPYGVDVSSGVEIQPGIKDREKILKFIENAKETEI